MNCNIIKDLLPLYIDECASADSAKAVATHLEGCPACRAAYEAMNAPAAPAAVCAPPKLRRVDVWRASLLQSLLLFFFFGVITVGVALEAGTPSGLLNSIWAFVLVIPATGFLLSLANWYFVRLYRSKTQFSLCSLLGTAVFTAAAYGWGLWHYEAALWMLFTPLFCLGPVFAVICCGLSFELSRRYAALLGKE